MDIPLKTASTSPAPGASASPEDLAKTFQPVKDEPQIQSGEKLLVEAYAAIWILVLAFVLLSWRKQRSVDVRIESLSAALDRVLDEGGLARPASEPLPPPKAPADDARRRDGSKKE